MNLWDDRDKNIKFDESNILPLAGILTAFYWALNVAAVLFATVFPDRTAIKDGRPAVCLLLAAFYGLILLVPAGGAAAGVLRKRWKVSKPAVMLWSLWLLSPVPALIWAWGWIAIMVGQW